MMLRRNSFWLAAVSAVCMLALLPAGQAAVKSVVTDWMDVARDTVLKLGIEHQQAARLYAMLATAQYDAIKGAQASTVSIPETAAAAYASHQVLSSWFNWRQSSVYDTLLAGHLAAADVTSDGQLSAVKVAVVANVQYLLSKRVKDDSSLFVNFKAADPTPANVGKYQFTPGQSWVHYPQVASADGFYLTSKEIDLYTAKLVRFNLDNPEYGAQLEETYWLGSATSPNRTQYDTDSARFWSLGDGTCTVAGFWVNVAIQAMPESTPLLVQARFLKLMTTSFWDTAVACWRVKFREAFWRPITAIRTAHGTRAADPSWSPLLSTPPDPEYASSHMCTSGAALYLLESHFGASTPFAATSLSAPDLGHRSYDSFRQAALEVGASRVFGGVHLRKSNEDGMALGVAIAKRIHTRFFRGATLADVF